MTDARFIVVTGTDTGVGKTVVASGLARALVLAGRRVVAVKPVETGCSGEPSEVEDGVKLALATGQAEPRAALLRFRMPVAAPVAADAEGATIDLEALARTIRAYAARADFVIVEGAGGLLSPLSWEGNLMTLAHALAGDPTDVHALTVASDRLGTVNHTALTANALAGAWLTQLGVVVSAPETDDASTGTNVDTLRRLRGGYVRTDRIAYLPRMSGLDEAAAALRGVAAWVL